MHFWDEYTSQLKDPEILEQLCAYYDAQEIPLKIRHHCKELIEGQIIGAEVDLKPEDFIQEIEKQFKTLPNFERHQLSWFKKHLATKYKHKPQELIDKFQICYDKENSLVDAEKGRLASASRQATVTTPSPQNLTATVNPEAPNLFRRRNDAEISRLKRDSRIFSKYLGSVKTDVFYQLNALQNAGDISAESQLEIQSLERTISTLGHPSFKLFIDLGEKLKRFKTSNLLEGLENDLNDWEYERKRSFIGFPVTIDLADLKGAAKDVQTILSTLKSCIKDIEEMEILDRGRIIPSEEHVIKFHEDLQNLQLQLFFITCRFEPTEFNGRSQDQKPILQYKTKYPLRASIFSAINTSIRVSNVSVNILTEEEAEEIKPFPFQKSVPAKTDATIGVISGNKIPEDPPEGRKIPKKRRESNIAIAPDSHLFVDFPYLLLTPFKGRRKGKRESELVTDDRYYFLVQFNFILDGKQYNVWRVSTPIAINSHGSQDWKAWGNMMWTYGDLSTQNQPKSQVIKRTRNWNELLSLLDSFYFKFTGSRLGPMQVKHLTNTAKRKNNELIQNYSEMCKLNLDEERKFSFWNWFYNSLALVKDFPLNAKHVHGFISKEDAKKLLSSKKNFTFLLRFRDSMPGSLSFAYVNRGEVTYAIPDPNQPLNLELHIRNTEILIYMYPDIHKHTLEYIPKPEKKQFNTDKPYYKKFHPIFRILSYETGPLSSTYANGSSPVSPLNAQQETEHFITYEDFCGSAMYLNEGYNLYPSPPYSEPDLSNTMDYELNEFDFAFFEQL